MYRLYGLAAATIMEPDKAKNQDTIRLLNTFGTLIAKKDFVIQTCVSGRRDIR